MPVLCLEHPVKRKDYDDDLLVELLARGEVSQAKIAERVGLDKAMVGLIARGRGRPDLQDRINAKTRQYLIERRRPGLSVGRRGRKKKYDEDLLVELIARGEMSCAEIGQRIGLARSMVAKIARGESRADLQDRINTRMRSCLADRRRRRSRYRGRFGSVDPFGKLKASKLTAGKLPSTALRAYDKASRTGEDPMNVGPPGLCRRRKEYDEDLLVELIGRGDTPCARIAKRVGLCPATVGKIARGESRPDLQARIAAVSRGIQEESCRLGARWLRGLLTRHIRDGLEGTGEHARRCRKDLIDKLFDPQILKRIAEPPPPEPEPPGADFDDLSLELRRKIMQEIGGPCEDADFVEIDADE